MGDNIDELLKSYGSSSEATTANPMDKLLKDIQKLKDGGN